jgi:hypothetical protein
MFPGRGSREGTVAKRQGLMIAVLGTLASAPALAEEMPAPAPPAATVPETALTRPPTPWTQLYARAGVVELGGAGGLAAASNYTRFELSPSAGIFVADDVELSLLTAFNYFRIGAMNTHPSSSATEFKVLGEPSFHLPFSREIFGFVGLGAGINYVTGQSIGLALQPRLGANFLVGRSGLLTPSLNVAYSSIDALRTAAGTVLAVQTSYGLDIGYTVMW